MIVLGLLIALGLGVLLLSALFPGALDADAGARMVYYGILLVAIGSSVVLGYRGRLGVAFKHILVWAGIALVLLLAYSLREEALGLGNRLLAELLPTRPMTTSPGVVELRAGSHGQFLADATVDGTPVRFLIDTGASGISLAPDDARRLGIDLAALDYVHPRRTANGVTMVAHARDATVQVGDIAVPDLAIFVHRDGLDQSLLGMSFLRRLSSYEVAGERLILRQ